MKQQLMLNRSKLTKDSKKLAAVTAAAFLMSLNINTFVHAGGLYPGGVTGLTLLIQRLCAGFLGISLPYTPINILLNAVPAYIGYRYVGKKFTLFSCLMIVLTSFFTDLLPHYAITYDTLLISIFGGLIQGCAISLCLLVGATSGGTDFVAIFFSERKGYDTWNWVLGFNIVILFCAGLSFGWDKALYSIIFQYTSTQVLHTLYQKYQQRTLLVVTQHPRAVYEAIYRTCHHGATVLTGEGSHLHRECTLVYSVIAGNDNRRVLRAIKAADPEAFVNVVKTHQLSGRFYKQPTE